MPPLVAAVAAYFAVSTAMAVFMIGATVVTLASIAYSAYMMASMGSPSQPDTNRLTTVRSAVQPHRIIYGRVKTGGVLVYAQSHSISPWSFQDTGIENDFITLVVAFAAHEIDGFESIWCNDRPSTDVSFNLGWDWLPTTCPPTYTDRATGQVTTNPTSTVKDPLTGGYYPNQEILAYTNAFYVHTITYNGTVDQQADPFLMSIPPYPTTIISVSPDFGPNDMGVINNTTTGEGYYTGTGVAVFEITIQSCGTIDSNGNYITSDTFGWIEYKYDNDVDQVLVQVNQANNIPILGAGRAQTLADGIQIQFTNGTGHSVNQTWEVRAYDGMPWNASCKLTNRAYAIVTLQNSTTIFPQGLPNITAILRGNNQIFDPRTNTTGYSTNLALCQMDYLIKPYGIGCKLDATTGQYDDINYEYAIAAANLCDEQVMMNGSAQSRYSMNGTFTVDKTPTQIMNEMLLCAYGALVWTQGQYRILPAAYYPPDPTFYGMDPTTPGLTESDLRGDIKVRPTSSLKDKFNTVRGTYVSTDTWQPVDFPPVYNQDYINADGGQLIKDVQFAYVTDPVTAMMVATIILEKGRLGCTVEFPAKWSAFPLAAGETVPVTNSLLDWNQKLFVIHDWKMNPDGGVDLTLVEEDPDVYSFDGSAVAQTLVQQPTLLPLPSYIAAPTNLQVQCQRYQSNSGATVVEQAVLSWTAGDNRAVLYLVQYQLQGATAWTNAPSIVSPGTTISGLAAGTYNFQIAAVNYVGGQSPWVSTSSYVPAPDTTVPNVTGLEIFGQGNNTVFTGQDLKLDWNKVNPLVNTGTTDLASPMKPDAWFRYYEVKIFTSELVLLRTEDVITEAYTYTFESNYADTNGNPERFLHVEVRAVATWGDESPVAAMLDVSNPPPAQVTGFGATAYIMAIGASWTPNTETDLAGYQLHAVPASELVDNAFTPSASNMINNGPESSFYYGVPSGGEWALMVAAYDTFGPTELLYSAMVTVTVPTLAALNTVPPDVPIDLSLTSAYITSAGAFSATVTAAWNEDSSGTVPYNNGVVRIKPTSGSTWSTYVVAQGLNTYTFTALVPGVSYDVQVAASDAFQNVSAFSATATIVAAGNTVAPDTVATPTLLFSFKNMYLNWVNVAQTDIACYEIQYSQDATFATGVTDVTVPPAGGLTSFPVTAGVTYYVRIRATNYSGLSGSWSTVVSGSTNLIGASDLTVTGALITESAQIGSATINNAAIISVSASKLTAGTVAIGNSLTLGAELANGAYPITINSAVGGVSDIEINDGTYVRSRFGTLPTGDIGAIIYDKTGAPVLKVDSTGAVIQNLTGGAIDADKVTINNLVVGGNVTMGPEAAISWSQVSGAPTIPTSLAALDPTAASTLSTAASTASSAASAASAAGSTASSAASAAASAASTAASALATAEAALPASSTILTYINSSGIYTGTVVASQVDAGVFTGLTFETAASGQRIVIDETTHSLIYYYTDGTTVLANIGGDVCPAIAAIFGNGSINTTGVSAFGSATGLFGEAGGSGGTGVSGQGLGSSSTGVNGLGSAYGVYGQSSVGVGVGASGTTRDLSCVNTGVLNLKPLTTLPTGSATGDVCIYYVTAHSQYELCVYQGGSWYSIAFLGAA